MRNYFLSNNIFFCHMNLAISSKYDITEHNHNQIRNEDTFFS
jgi:hypothetical protein